MEKENEEAFAAPHLFVAVHSYIFPSIDPSS